MAKSGQMGNLQKLLSKAENKSPTKNGWNAASVKYLYRCKPNDYFEDILSGNGIMEKVLKDDGGDPSCPINGKLQGVFFGVTLFNNDLPDKSPYGNKMVLVPLKEIFTSDVHLYFADFYCLRGYPKNHYVCLVVTKDGTVEDVFCKKNLIKLNLKDNRFLWKEESKPFKTANISGLYLEIFYTENVNIKGRSFLDVDLLGQGHSTPGGIPKSDCCETCNV